MSATQIAVRGVAVIAVMSLVSACVLKWTGADTSLVVAAVGLASSCATGLIGYASHKD
jgi:hypothetical protein